MVLAAGLALAGVAHAAAPAAPVAEPAATTATTPAAATAPADPTIGQDGAPVTKPAAGIGQPVDRHLGLQAQVTPNGRRAHWFHDVVLLPLITAISIFVLILLAVVIVKFRRAANPVPSRTSHNTMIEIVWTLLPVLILVVVAVPSIRLLAAQFKPAPDGAVTLKAIGNQWYWSYEYPDHGGIQLTSNMLKEQAEVPAGTRFRTDADGPRLLATDQRVVLPVGVPIRLVTTANDVIHSWAVPAFWIKLDAVPGRLNETSFVIEKPGVYYGQCSELCGARHAYMPITVEAVEPAVFARWVAAKGGTMPTPGAASSAAPAQPGADVADDTSNATAEGDNIGDALVNAIDEPATTNQAATGTVE